MTTFPASSADEDLLNRLRANLAVIRERISNSSASPDRVRIVAVSKTFPASYIRGAYELGLRHFGENYLGELEAKVPLLSDLDLTWHYLGALQSNKITRVAALAGVVSTLSRVKELEKLATLGYGGLVDLQVDFTHAPLRNGAEPGEIENLAQSARDLGLNLRGLMVVAPQSPIETRAAFSHTTDLARRTGLGECSMGMSDDLEVACEFCTTELRLGRALFGPRVRHDPLA